MTNGLKLILKIPKLKRLLNEMLLIEVLQQNVNYKESSVKDRYIADKGIDRSSTKRN